MGGIIPYVDGIELRAAGSGGEVATPLVDGRDVEVLAGKKSINNSVLGG
jgi:hypothetical protein